MDCRISLSRSTETGKRKGPLADIMESRWGNTGGVLLLLLVAAISSGMDPAVPGERAECD